MKPAPPHTPHSLRASLFRLPLRSYDRGCPVRGDYFKRPSQASQFTFLKNASTYFARSVAW